MSPRPAVAWRPWTGPPTRTRAEDRRRCLTTPSIRPSSRRRRPPERRGSRPDPRRARDAPQRGRFGASATPSPTAEPPRRPKQPGKAIRLEVTEGGRKVVNLRIPLALGRAALSRVPGLIRRHHRPHPRSDRSRDHRSDRPRRRGLRRRRPHRHRVGKDHRHDARPAPSHLRPGHALRARRAAAWLICERVPPRWTRWGTRRGRTRRPGSSRALGTLSGRRLIALGGSVVADRMRCGSAR